MCSLGTVDISCSGWGNYDSWYVTILVGSIDANL